MDLQTLRNAKKAKKMTLMDISVASGIPKRTVDDIFSGHTVNPRIDTLNAIERALGIQTEKSTASKIELNELQLRLLTAFNSLLPAMQENVLGIVENLAAQSGGANADKRGEA